MTIANSVLFVDAGYLLAGSGDVLFGTTSRVEITCNYPSLIQAIKTRVAEHSRGLRLLRTYWYDGARSGVPTPDHRLIESIPYVKVRLGRVTPSGQQKGIETMMVRDLLTLARERAVARAYLLTGDEELCEAVRSAQDMGVQVVLMALVEGERTGRSHELVRETDELIELDEDFLRPHFQRRELPNRGALEDLDEDAIRDAAREFVDRWIEVASRRELDELLAAEPRIPRDIDVQLIESAEETLGSLRDLQDAKIRLRDHFWAAVKEKVE
ncbi:MAG: NYN domain-containing protein [Thermoleophilum sp.]|nr:NYN domain-containing protein [Thermoleophilum sp.]